MDFTDLKKKGFKIVTNWQECNKNTSQNNKVGGKKNMKGGDGNIFEKSNKAYCAVS